MGRGCLFGPVWAAAVVLPPQAFEGLRSLGVTDSKALSAKRRAALLPVIQSQLLAFGYGQASAQEIDAKGIRVATELAMLLKSILQLSLSLFWLELQLVSKTLPTSQNNAVRSER